MKKVNLLLFFVFFLIYEEIMLSCFLFKEFPISIWLISLFTIPIAIICNYISNIFKTRGNKIATYILTILFIILFGTQLVYYSMYESIISFYSILNGGQVTEFIDIILDMIIRNWFGIILFFIPLIILIFLNKKNLIDYEKMGWKGNLIKLGVLVIIQTSAILCVNFINTKDIYSNKNIYYNTHVPNIMVKNMGFLTTMRKDFQRFVFGFKEKIMVNSIIDEDEHNEDEEQEYNILQIDYDKLISNENNEQVKEIHEYVKNVLPSKKNEYTGFFKDKNIIVIVAESFSSLAIRRDLMPNLYKLYEEGFQFNNFYTPIFPVSTADGEYITDTSLIPKEGVWSFKEIVGNYMPYSYANIFKELGYSTNAYHNHTATYYNRDRYIKTMGYDSYLAVGTGLEDRMDTSKWPNSDYEMMDVTIDDYINNDKFLAYYMTVSGHMNYTRIGNAMVDRNWDKVKSMPYSEKAKCYLAANIELDKAIGKLLEKLENVEKLEDTVIVISGDHVPYGLTLDEINELSKYKRDDKFEKYHMPLLIWSGSMEKPIKVDKIGSSLDVLPTVLNLFGVDFDSRLLIGRDILSDSNPLVIFSDRSFITDKGRYNSLTNEFIKNEDVEIENVDEYVQNINSVIYKKYQMSRLILENDYYKKVFGE